MKKLIRNIFNSIGYSIVKNSVDPYPDFDKDFWPLYNQCQSETMTSVERMYSLYKACEYVHHNSLTGDYVECGVWRGGSSMLAALAFNKLNDTSRDFYLYDTYEGMSDPTENDISIKNDVVYKNWQSIKKSNSKIFAYASLEVVKANLSKTHYPSERLHFVKGKVEDTIPKTIPSKISILRLDTDWYESTKHEMEHLFPLLQVHGILIIDDYGHWKGSRKAVDDYFKSKGIYPFLHRVDYTARLYIKQNQQ